MLWMTLLACSTSTPDPLVGCWLREARNHTACFGATGTYTFESPKAGRYEGTWKREGDKVDVQVDPFPKDVYTISFEGESLVLTRPEREPAVYVRKASTP